METLIIVGSSLSAALIALANRDRAKQRRIVLIDSQHRFGGGPVQPYFSDTLSPEGEALVADAIVGEWPHYLMLRQNRATSGSAPAVPDMLQFDRAVCLLAPEQIHADLVTALPPGDLRRLADIGPLSIGRTSVDLGNERIEGDAVLDLRPARGHAVDARIELEMGSHLPEGTLPLSAPVLADDTIEAGPGGALQYFPMDPRWLVMRRMWLVAQDDPGLARDTATAPIGSIAARRTVFPFNGPAQSVPMPVPSALLPSEVPGAVALALTIAACPTLASLDTAMTALARHHAEEGAERLAALHMLAEASDPLLGASLSLEALVLASRL
ncbi:hypothetical protein HGI47_17675 [Novosphingobium sp. ERN07]|uniref:hypothetical protein n=1 Tax=Novosphingobium sp. ERN07 TaxID=2726187 RepID=UPI0014564701|nr:hypothetical protein [Novosphingobium sp. ERN07]NLR72707.1 hypothetical protein [Novosphingobium sp. ERN07]